MIRSGVIRAVAPRVGDDPGRVTIALDGQDAGEVTVDVWGSGVLRAAEAGAGRERVLVVGADPPETVVVGAAVEVVEALAPEVRDSPSLADVLRELEFSAIDAEGRFAAALESMVRHRDASRAAATPPVLAPTVHTVEGLTGDDWKAYDVAELGAFLREHERRHRAEVNYEAAEAIERVLAELGLEDRR